MRSFRRYFLPIALALAVPLLAYAQQTAPLQQRMSAAEFKAAGLDKLSPQELQNLEAWLGTHVKAGATRVVDTSGAPVFYPSSEKRSAIATHIKGSFAGWTGHNHITLDNGQEWKQIGSDQPMCGTANNPKVTIKPSLFGNWLAYVDGCNDMVHVRRVH